MLTAAPSVVDDPPTKVDPGLRAKLVAILAASSGNLVEWYDFFAYAFTSIYFAGAFFPSGDPTSQLLSTAGIFALGFFFRPLGGYVFGRFADRYGRRASMVASVLLMSAGSLLISVLPTYASIGLAAPGLLLLARSVQGLSVGGEYGTAATYMSEIATPGRRGFFSSFQSMTLIGGQLLALLVIGILQQLLTTEDLKAWGWRIPFAFGGLAGVTALYLRRSLAETLSDSDMRRREAGSLRALWKFKRAVCIVFGLTAAGALYFYTFTTYIQKYLVNTAHLDPSFVSSIITASLIYFMLLQPAFGALSDRIGRRASMMIFGLSGTIVAVPLLKALSTATASAWTFVLLLVALTVACFYTAISGIVKAELFPPEIRALATGFVYAVANALFGGTAEYVALSMKSAGRESLFGWYVAGACLLAFAAALWMPHGPEKGYLSDGPDGE